MRKNEHIAVHNLLVTYNKNHSNGKFFLLASPAWGKTTLIMNLYLEKKFKRIAFLSPLVALNLELCKRLSQNNCPTFDISADILSENIEGIVVCTPEKLFFNQFEESLAKWADLIVIDEFHLLLLWSDFRPTLFECWLWLSMVDRMVLFLSGTFLWNKWANTFEGKLWLNNAQNYCKLDLHEMTLIHEPKYYFYFKGYFKSFVALGIKFILLYFTSLKVILFFSSREQVRRWARWCRKFKISYLSCLGGEASVFSTKLNEHSHPQVILSTSVLSHGVNLPPRDLVIIWGQDWSKELWLQMKSRGGRNGEKYYFVSEKQVWMN